MVSDWGRVQVFRRNGRNGRNGRHGSYLRAWTSTAYGEPLGVLVHIGCIQELVFIISDWSARMDVFALDGPCLFTFPLIEKARGITCGAEEVYVTTWTHVTVNSAFDGTQLRTLRTPGLGITWRWTYGPNATLACTSFLPGDSRSSVCVISAANGALLGRTTRTIRNVQWQRSILLSWHENSDLFGLAAKWRLCAKFKLFKAPRPRQSTRAAFCYLLFCFVCFGLVCLVCLVCVAVCNCAAEGN